MNGSDQQRRASRRVPALVLALLPLVLLGLLVAVALLGGCASKPAEKAVDVSALEHAYTMLDKGRIHIGMPVDWLLAECMPHRSRFHGPFSTFDYTNDEDVVGVTVIAKHGHLIQATARSETRPRRMFFNGMSIADEVRYRRLLQSE